jgi:hypothetical protein
MKTIIAGSRNIVSASMVYGILDAMPIDISEVFCGLADGVDALGSLWARSKFIPVRDFKADWNDITVDGARIRVRKDGSKFNSYAGHQRNEKMAIYADALIVIWDGSSRGSRDMLKRAHNYKLKICEVRLQIDYFNMGG